MATKINLTMASLQLEVKLGELETEYDLTINDLIMLCDAILGDGSDLEIDDEAVGVSLVTAESDRYTVLNLGNYDLIPIGELIKPKDGARVILNRYWQSYQGKVMVYINRGFYVPQCNDSIDVIKRNLPYECEVVWIEQAYFMDNKSG